MKTELSHYRNAPSGEGPLAATWKDKPHRLVYDLCTLIEMIQEHRHVIMTAVAKNMTDAIISLESEIAAIIEAVGNETKAINAVLSRREKMREIRKNYEKLLDVLGM